jgi:hypothetical protein
LFKPLDDVIEGRQRAKEWHRVRRDVGEKHFDDRGHLRGFLNQPTLMRCASYPVLVEDIGQAATK